MLKSGDPGFEKVRGWIKFTFRDKSAEVDDVVVSGVIDHLEDQFRPEYAQLGLRARAAPTRKVITRPIPKLPTGPGFYLVESTHSRISGPAQHSFTGVVPMVRAQLPDDTRNVLCDSPMGQVWASDVKLYSLPVFRDYYKDVLRFHVARVDVWTPPRIDGARFGAIMFMIARDDAGTPRAFVLGGGMANGKTRVLYCSPDMKPIDSKAGYKATPFTSIDHLYHGNLALRSDGEPEEVQIDIRAAKDTPVVLKIRARIRAVHEPEHRSPYAMLAEAALRVCAIADKRGEEVPELGPLTKPLGNIARAIYTWNDLPH